MDEQHETSLGGHVAVVWGEPVFCIAGFYREAEGGGALKFHVQKTGHFGPVLMFSRITQ